MKRDTVRHSLCLLMLGLAVLATTSGCQPYSARNYAGATRPSSEVAVVWWYRPVGVWQIDGSQNWVRQLESTKWHDGKSFRVEVLPGRHRFLVKYDGRGQSTEGTEIQADLLPGRSYAIEPRTKGESWSPVIVEKLEGAN